VDVIISNLAWLKQSDLDSYDVYFIKNDCTIVPRAGADWMPNKEPVVLYRKEGDYVGIPRFYYEEVFKKKSLERHPPFRFKEINKIPKGRSIKKYEPSINLYEQQKEAVDEFLSKVKDDSKIFSGGIFSAHVGAGKTICSFYIANALGGKTLVLAHTEPLLDQLRRSLLMLFPDATIGRIQGKVCDYEGKDFVFATLQSLMNESGDKYPAEIFDYFETVVIDEMHRSGAASFSTVVPKFSVRYTVGLTGTSRRADGCENVFYYYIGSIASTMKQDSRLIPSVWVRETGFNHMSLYDSKHKPKIVTALAASKKRSMLIAEHVFKAMERGRNPLVMSERISILQDIYSFVETMIKAKNLPYTQDFYIGGKDEDALIKASQATAVYATIQIAREGIDIKRLDTLFLTTPVSDVEQVSGRVTRVLEGKKEPLIVDYVDSNIVLCQGSFNSRMRFYRKLGCKII